MDACTTRNTLKYAHKQYKLEINKDRGKFYNNNKLIFQGFAFKALMMFIDNCNDDNDCICFFSSRIIYKIFFSLFIKT